MTAGYKCVPPLFSETKLGGQGEGGGISLPPVYTSKKYNVANYASARLPTPELSLAAAAATDSSAGLDIKACHFSSSSFSPFLFKVSHAIMEGGQTCHEPLMAPLFSSPLRYRKFGHQSPSLPFHQNEATGVHSRREGDRSHVGTRWLGLIVIINMWGKGKEGKATHGAKSELNAVVEAAAEDENFRGPCSN